MIRLYKARVAQRNIQCARTVPRERLYLLLRPGPPKYLRCDNDPPNEINRILTERKTPMPAKMTLAGENTYQITSEDARSLTLALMSRLTRLTPPETAAENAERTLTVGPNHCVNLSSPL